MVTVCTGTVVPIKKEMHLEIGIVFPLEAVARKRKRY
jgi:hypothetical protein